MFIKKLTINGFKSFCDQAEISFDKGISAIVGPNGCGKSNIVDAIKWVVGEQKTRALRANNMTDVIFKGTEERRGLGRAEVKLVIVNENNILPIEFNEVEISRVIFASGESEYYINKQKVRLKDIQELFFDTGVGKSAYSVMEQGKIDMILSNKPEDRRYIIEEAAGITKYRVKREEADSKLYQAEENIIRIKDIVKEVKTQFERSSDQAKKADEYRRLYDREKELEIELNLNRIVKHKQNKSELTDELEKATKDLEQVKKQIDSLEDGLEERMIFLNDMENQKIDKQREIFQIESEIRILTSRNSSLKEQLITHISGLKSEKEKIDMADKKIAELSDEVKGIEDARIEMEEKLLNLVKDEGFYNSSVTDIETRVKNNEETILNIKKEVDSLNRRVEERRVEHKNITDKMIERIDQILNLIDVDSSEIIKIKENLKIKIKNISEELPKRRAFIDDIVNSGFISKNSSEIINILKELKEKIVSIETNLFEVDRDLNAYIKSTEVFMDDLFNPEGIIQTKKRIEIDINKTIENIKKSNEHIERLQIENRENNVKKEEYKDVLHNIRINISTIREKTNSMDKELSRILYLKDSIENGKDEAARKAEFLESKIDDIRDELADIETKLNSMKNDKEGLEKRIRELDLGIQKENSKMSEEQKYVKEVNQRWENKKGQIERLNLKITEATTTINNIYDSFYENLSINLSEYESKGGYITNRSYEEVRKELSEVRNGRQSLGNVNLMAIEECKALEDRYKLLSEQLDDLEKSKKDTIQMISEINKISEEMFLKTFNQIKINFHKIFRKLFDGGNAEITLTDPKNLLETGIDIIAHPPGQKFQNITLLSGGQRTMTAISLMFATFLVKPSPFCILDEIDAALDEENVARFINLLKEFKETSQFVIITHNKKTITASDVMYGVTQEQKGISKIVSAKFVEKVE
ncbi:MAG TPA: AAA family ATPase [Spirochaetota bacterium]|jgi:chromosome segregation protein|nr:MAG: Chromosome partition protein Smc [Spirochaetes bacterium ADurb.Bin133]HNZ25633.1 AAA family ATPase [Spirochaetota bacterium]